MNVSISFRLACVLVVAGGVLIVPPFPADVHGQGVTGTIKSIGKQVTKGAQAGAQKLEDLGSKFARYVKNAKIMRGHHDATDLDPGAITDFLRGRGLGSSGANTAPPRGAPPPTGARGRETFPTAYAGSYGWPLEAGIVSSEYGPRWGKFHAGIDIAADVGEPVLASAPGIVIYAGSGLKGYGNVVIIRSDVDTTTLYAHNKTLLAKEGDSVAQVQKIATVGSSGRSTGPHGVQGSSGRARCQSVACS